MEACKDRVDEFAFDAAHGARVEASAVVDAALLRSQTILPILVQKRRLPVGCDGAWLLDRLAIEHILRSSTKLLQRNATANASLLFSLARLQDAMEFILAAATPQQREQQWQRYIPFAEVCVMGEHWSLVCSSYTLPHTLTKAVHQASFFNDIADVDVLSLEYLMCKALNSRCQLRLYGRCTDRALLPRPEVTHRYLYRELDPCDDKTRARFERLYQEQRQRRLDYRQMIFCSLLGNYIHCTTRLEGAAQRRRLRRLMLPVERHEAPSASNWFLQALLHGAPNVVLWCVREFIVHTLLDDPGLLAQVGAVMNFGRFRYITGRAMAAIRQYLSQNLTRHWSQLDKATHWDDLYCRCQLDKKNKKKTDRPKQKQTQTSNHAAEPVCKHAANERNGEWLSDLERLVAPFKQPLLDIAYKKPKDSELIFLLSAKVRGEGQTSTTKGVAPLVPIPVQPKEEEEEDVIAMAALAEVTRADREAERLLRQDEEEDDEIHTFFESLDPNRMMDMMNKHDFLARFQAWREKRRAMELATRQDWTDARSKVHRYLSARQFAALSFLVEEVMPPEATLGDCICELHSRGGFGLSGASCDYILTILRAHRDGRGTLKARLACLQQLQQRAPHAYNLLQLTAELLRRTESGRARVVGRLSAEATEAQIEAARKKWFLSKDAALTLLESTSLYLYYCRVCDEIYSNVRDLDAPEKKAYYRFGLDDPNVAYESVNCDPYCRQRKVNHRGACGDHPLVRVCLLGIRFAFGGREYQLCTGCCDIMALSTEGRNSYDYASGALQCNVCAKKQQLSWMTHERNIILQLGNRRCVCCRKSAGLERGHLYPFNLCVCRRHHSKKMVQRVNELQPKTEAECRAAMVDLHVNFKKHKRDKAKKGDNERMQQRKRRDRMKRA